MPNHMKFCGCPACRAGMHRRSRAKGTAGDRVRAAVRKFRQTVKRALRRGDEPDDKFGVPYTD